MGILQMLLEIVVVIGVFAFAFVALKNGDHSRGDDDGDDDGE